MPRLMKRLFLLASALLPHAVVARGYFAANNSSQYADVCRYPHSLHVLTTG
jgi:hypothetical protein